MYLLLTIDTEGNMYQGKPLPLDGMVYGRSDEGEFGIGRIMDAFDARGMKATFFVSALEHRVRGDSPMREVCELIAGRGHDVQLHIHSAWTHQRKFLWELSLPEQRDAISEGQSKLTEWLGQPPAAHRAGGLGANADTLRALADLGIGIDSSQAVGYAYDRLNSVADQHNAPYMAEGVLEAPVTTFVQTGLGPLKVYRNLDINADSLGELKCVVRQCLAGGMASVVLLMHSFSLVHRDYTKMKFLPNWHDLHRFERFLDWVQREPSIEPITFGELWRRHGADANALLGGSDVHPHTGLFRTYCRAWERFGSGWKSKAAALAPVAAAAGSAAAYWLL